MRAGNGGVLATICNRFKLGFGHLVGGIVLVEGAAHGIDGQQQYMSWEGKCANAFPTYSSSAGMASDNRDDSKDSVRKGNWVG